tara:strand:- start:113 stop:235 length:123 start_codon:yes stop_codon:yes gene_type:complete
MSRLVNYLITTITRTVQEGELEVAVIRKISEAEMPEGDNS